MLNVLVDVGDYGGLEPFVGVGAGVGYTTMDISPANDEPAFASFDPERPSRPVRRLEPGTPFIDGHHPASFGFGGLHHLLRRSASAGCRERK